MSASAAPLRAPARAIVVAGDVSVDWLLPSAAGERRAPVDFIWMWGGAYACRAISSSGGAASHAKILRAAAAAARLSGVTVIGPEVPLEALASPYHSSYAYTYARIQRFPRELGSAGGTAWRIAEFLGSDPAPSAPPARAPSSGRPVHRSPARRSPSCCSQDTATSSP